MSMQYTTPPPPRDQQPGHQQNPVQVRGERLARASKILGVLSLISGILSVLYVGLIFGVYWVGIVLGPLAIWKAKQAKALNVVATVGRVTGWIGTILNGLAALLVIGYMIFFLWMGYGTRNL